MNVGQLINELQKYPKGMSVASIDTQKTYGPIIVDTDGDNDLDEPFEWLVICCPDWRNQEDGK